MVLQMNDMEKISCLSTPSTEALHFSSVLDSWVFWRSVCVRVCVCFVFSKLVPPRTHARGLPALKHLLPRPVSPSGPSSLPMSEIGSSPKQVCNMLSGLLSRCLSTSLWTLAPADHSFIFNILWRKPQFTVAYKLLYLHVPPFPAPHHGVRSIINSVSFRAPSSSPSLGLDHSRYLVIFT